MMGMPCAALIVFFPYTVPFLSLANTRRLVFMHIDNYVVLEQIFSKP